jgi:hypothetical protein
LRAFTFGHVRQLERVLGETLRRAWAAGAGPKDPFFVDKVRDVVGLYLDPPERAVVLCVDEKSQIHSRHVSSKASSAWAAASALTARYR